MPENITVLEACRRMAARRVDAALLTDSNALLCGILTDKDVATRVIARELRLDDTPVSKVMTRNPVFVLSNTLAVEALQKMVQGKFRHLPVVENGEVIALLDIAKCLYDAIARMERASEKGKAIAAAVEGVEKNWGTAVSGPNTFIETLREQMFRPSLSTIIKGNSNSRDILMRVIARNLSPELTPVEKVMTPNPECGTVDIPILDALRTMQDGKFLHLPVLDRDGNIVSVVDVIDITHAAFWDSAMAMGPLDDEDDSRSETSMKMASEGTETAGSPYPSSSVPTTAFTFKLADKKGRMHRFTCDTQSLAPLITCILQRLGCDITGNNLPQILYEDEDCDKVVLSSDTDLAAAVDHARLADYSSSEGRRRGGSGALDFANRDAWAAAYSGAAAGAALVACL
ncbi:CBS domain-containing protein CBSCBSPB5, partial [Ananas comosus]